MIVNVVICTYDRYEMLDLAIGSVVRQDMDPDAFQITIIDNSPDAELSARQARQWRGCRNLLWHHEPIPGLSHARNLGLEATSCPLVAFLDDDAIAAERWLARMVDAFEQLGPEVHAIGGRVRLRFQGPRPSWLADSMLAYLSACDLGEEARLVQRHEWVVGANVAYRTTEVKAAGGFSTALGRVGGGAALMSNDETELRERMAARGGLLGYAPGAEVDHVVLAERLRQSWFRRRLAWQAVSDYVASPDAARRDAGAAWARTKAFLASCPPADRTLRGLAIAELDEARFGAQIGATYDAVTAILAGLDEDDAD